MESCNECGLSFDGFSDFQEADVIDCYRVEFKVKTMSMAINPSLLVGNTGNKAGSNVEHVSRGGSGSSYSNMLQQ